MNKTPNYQLNQWEAGDRVQRTDFNADNAKIDAAIQVLDTKKCEVIAGTYTGDGAAQREISLGRKPKAVFVCTKSGFISDSFTGSGGLAVPDGPAYYGPRISLSLTGAGFNVYYQKLSGGTVATNSDGGIYNYIAFC